MHFQVTEYDLKNGDGEVYASLTDGFDDYQAHIDTTELFNYAEKRGDLKYSNGDGSESYEYSFNEFIDGETEVGCEEVEVDYKSLILEFIEAKNINPKIL